MRVLNSNMCRSRVVVMIWSISQCIDVLYLLRFENKRYGLFSRRKELHYCGKLIRKKRVVLL